MSYTRIGLCSLQQLPGKNISCTSKLLVAPVPLVYRQIVPVPRCLQVVSAMASDRLRTSSPSMSPTAILLRVQRGHWLLACFLPRSQTDHWVSALHKFYLTSTGLCSLELMRLPLPQVKSSTLLSHSILSEHLHHSAWKYG